MLYPSMLVGDICVLFFYNDFLCALKWCYPKWWSTGTWIAHATHRLFLSGTYEFGKWNRRKIRGLGLLDKRGNGALYCMLPKKKEKRLMLWYSFGLDNASTWNWDDQVAL